MRTTIRIDDDLLERLKSRAESENTSLTRLVNRVIRSGLSASDHVADNPRYEQKTYDLGEPQFDMTNALALAALFEDEETVRKLKLRK